MKKNIYLIAAADLKGGIGKKGRLPWHFKKDLAFFQKTTTKTKKILKLNMVIMGRTTWESIPEEHRPLKARLNIVLTRQKDYKAAGATTFNSLEDAIDSADEKTESIFIIGGEKVFKKAIERRDIEGIYLTRIKKQFDCDTRFPKIPRSFKSTTLLGTAKEGETEMEFLFYEKNSAKKSSDRRRKKK